jgi:serine/threonine-protein phosphatase 5
VPWGVNFIFHAVVEADYDGVPLGSEMTKEFLENMIDRFKNGKKIHKKYAYQIVLKAKEIFYSEPTMPEVKIDEGRKLTVCGDTHGISSPWCNCYSAPLN